MCAATLGLLLGISLANMSNIWARNSPISSRITNTNDKNEGNNKSSDSNNRSNGKNNTNSSINKHEISKHMITIRGPENPRCVV